MHADLNASSKSDTPYNPIPIKQLEEKGFDYIALGHIHKPNFVKNIVYPGSAFPQGFDELGKRGMVVGSLKKVEDEVFLEKEFIELNEIEFSEKEIDVTNLNSVEQLAEAINDLPINDSELVKVVLIGKRNFEIDIYELYKLIENEKIIKMKNKTKTSFNLDELANSGSLKGLYIQEIQKRINLAETEEEKVILENAIDIGLEALE